MSAAVSEPALSVLRPGGEVRAIALVLHGGRATSTAPVRPRHLAVVRMRPFVSSLRSAGEQSGLAVAALRYAVRGWNGEARSPLADVRSALDRLGDEYPGVPVGLVGHSMGGRSSLHEAGQPAVRSVVALAPWIEAGDPYEQLAGRRLLVAHGSRDHTTSPKSSAALVRTVQDIAASAAYVRVHGDGHAMLRRASLWHGLATAFTLAALCDVPPAESIGGDAANVVEKALAGTQYLDV